MRDHDLGSPSKYQDHQLEISCVYVCPFAKQDYQVEILYVWMSLWVSILVKKGKVSIQVHSLTSYRVEILCVPI